MAHTTRTTLLAATILGTLALLPGGAAQAQPVTGLYIGGGAGANFMQPEAGRSFRSQTVTTTGGRTTASSNAGRLFGDSATFDVGGVGVASVGYGFGNGLRIELEGNYRYNPIQSSGATVSREEKYGGMLNALFDLDVGSPYIFPYIGGGAGYNWVDQRVSTRDAFGFSTIRGVDSSFAYQAIAGVSLPVPPVVGLSVTAEYRFFGLTGDRSFGVRNSTVSPGFSQTTTGRYTTTDNFNHSLLLGLRYAFNVAPPPPVEAQPAPPATANRTYLVFFDWDRADLTDRARQIIAEAAQATQRTQTTRIEVAGHTDSSGTARYNAGLSVRRAQNVTAELVRLGVPRAAISVQGFGETRPLVQTAQGVREPQNRRVEIVLR